MTEYDNTNRGIFGRNKYKEKENQPDYKGKINVDGVEKVLSGWKRVSEKTGETFISLQIQDPYVKPDEKPEQKIPAGPIDDNIPF